MNSSKLQALIAICLFTFMCTLDGSIVNIALLAISHDLNISFSLVTWTMTAYLVVLSGLLLLFGRLGDLIGKVRVFKVGMVVFTLGSFLSGANFGLGFGFLIFARVFQAVGSAMTLANSFGITSALFPLKQRARALSIIAMFTSVGLMAGPALGGLILQIASWPIIFWVNVPIGIIAFFLGIRFLPKEAAAGNWRDLDKTGSFLFFFVIACLLFGLNEVSSVIGKISLVLAIILFIAFIYVEQHKKHSPLVDLGIFKNGLFSLSLTTAVLMFTAGAFYTVLLPLYLQENLHLASGFAGLIMLGYPVGIFILSPIAGILSDKFDKEVITIIGISGAFLAALGFVFLAQGNQGFLSFYVLVFLSFYGASIGFFKSPNNTLIMSSVDQCYLGIAGSINTLANYFGMMLGTTISTLTLFAAMSGFAGRTVASYSAALSHEFVSGLRVAFGLSLLLIALAWLMSFVRVLRRNKTV